MRRWNSEVIRAHNSDANENQLVSALTTPVCPGLAAHRSFWKSGSKRRWTLTHTNSGKSAGTTDSKRDAMQALLILGTKNIDWTLNTDQLCTKYYRLMEVVNAAITESKRADSKQRYFA